MQRAAKTELQILPVLQWRQAKPAWSCRARAAMASTATEQNGWSVQAVEPSRLQRRSCSGPNQCIEFESSGSLRKFWYCGWQSRAGCSPASWLLKRVWQWCDREWLLIDHHLASIAGSRKCLTRLPFPTAWQIDNDYNVVLQHHPSEIALRRLHLESEWSIPSCRNLRRTRRWCASNNLFQPPESKWRDSGQRQWPFRNGSWFSSLLMTQHSSVCDRQISVPID